MVVEFQIKILNFTLSRTTDALNGEIFNYVSKAMKCYETHPKHPKSQ